MNVQCFMVRWNGKGRRYLSRSTSCTKDAWGDARCPLRPGEYSWHSAESRIIDVVDDPQDPATGCWTLKRRGVHLFGKSNSWWPRTCQCGYVFRDSDYWSVNIDHVYVADSGREYTLHDNVPGMMWECDWYFDPVRDLAELPARIARAREGKDMLSLRYLEQHAKQRAPLCVILPTGEHWVIDSKAANGPGWTCAGEPPLLVCTPSILSTRWHGFLGSAGSKPGELKSC